MPLTDILSRIATAEGATGRKPGSVRLIAVSKLQPAERVEAVLRQGHRVYGENYVQEAQAKWPGWRARFGAVEVHLVGPLQTNKAKVAVEVFDAIHALDRPSLADKLARLAQARGACPNLFVQVNTGAEPQKAGALPEDTDALIAQARSLGLIVEGLMCIPPADEAPGMHFELLGKIARRNRLEVLSMGMSGDYETAIGFGATHVRVGSALFGERNTSQTASME